MKKLHMSLLLACIMGSTIGKAEAHDSFGLSINLGGPSYYSPPAVYYAPPPVVYYRPAPIYYGPSAYLRFEDGPRYRPHEYKRGWGNGWRGEGRGRGRPF